MSGPQKSFSCSFCEKLISFQPEQLGRRGKCPSCGRIVVLLDNKDGDSDQHIRSYWYYRRARLLFGIQEVGPIEDSALLQLLAEQQIDSTTEVMSRELTKGVWSELGRLNLALVQQLVEQRHAELQRRQRVAERRRQVEAENRLRLQRGIRSAIETGSITSGHRQAIERFAIAAGIPADEVSECMSRESQLAVRGAFDDALNDGILEPLEEQQISQLAVALNARLEFSSIDQRRISLCRLAHEIDSGAIQYIEAASTPFKLAPRERVVGQVSVTWHEIAALKRPQGIPLGGDNYLKSISAGDAFLTTKQVTMVGAFQFQKFTLSSVQKVSRYTDGVLFNRSSGKSIFLEFDVLTEVGGRFALLAEHVCSGDPVLGFEPSQRFVPEPDVSSGMLATQQTRFPVSNSSSDPKYTFRVVGDHVDQRALYINALRPGDTVRLVREPHNPFDSNAVAVFDTSRRQLGYLKREVASWFAPILESKGAVAKAHAFTAAGSLIVGVYL